MSRSLIKVDGSLEYYLQTGVRLTMPRAKNKILPSGSIQKQRNVLILIDEQEYCTIGLFEKFVPGAFLLSLTSSNTALPSLGRAVRYGLP